jgi:BMFP domain-containing protein YqiC
MAAKARDEQEVLLRRIDALESQLAEQQKSTPTRTSRKIETS